MDNLTHTLFGATLARTPLNRAGRGATAALLLASNAPDIDIVMAAGGGLSYLQWHRGPTHGPLGVIAQGLVVAGIVWAGSRLLDREGTGRQARFSALAAVSILGVLLHVLMDLPTSYGTRLLSPFDWHWHAVDLMPIIDIYLLTILAACLWFGRTRIGAGEATVKGPRRSAREEAVSESRHASALALHGPTHSGEARGATLPGSPRRAARRNVVIALSLMAANYGVRIVAHREALATAPRVFGPTLPDRCDAAADQGPIVDRWPIHREGSARDAGRRCLLEIAALPTFGSPFRWRLVAHLSNAYDTREIDLIEARLRPASGAPDAPWRLVQRAPNHWTPEVAQAATARTAQIFLGFSRFPLARSATAPDGSTTVTWSDVRFTTRPLRTADGAGGSGLFMATVVVAPDGRIRRERLGP